MDRIRAGVLTTHRDRLPETSRYELLVRIASGGMATVYVGRLTGAVGFTRSVAIKRAHAHLLEDPAFKKMLVVEAKLASRIHHPNVVAVLDVEETEGELLLVMDYVEGAALSELVGTPEDDAPLPARLAVRILLDACAGLHAAHELTDDDGKPLGLVHRDVSPHNILVGTDGTARIADFGIAKASSGHSSSAQTATGALKGKVGYMAPEYVDSGRIDARTDVFALGVVAWEALTRKRLFRGNNEVDTLRLVLACEVPAPSSEAPWLGTALDAVVLKALARDPAARFSTAAELADALESAARREDLLGSHAQVRDYVRSLTASALEKRRALVRERTGVSLVHADDAPAEEPGRTLTLPIGGESKHDDEIPVDVGTLGSGVSARHVSEVRTRSGAKPRRVVAVAIGATVLGAIATFGVVRSATQSTATSTPAATSTSTPTATPTATSTPTPTATATPTSTATSTPTATSTATSTPTEIAATSTVRPAKPAAKPASSTKPLATGITRVFPSSKPPEAPAAATGDKAPPNPYAN